MLNVAHRSKYRLLCDTFGQSVVRQAYCNVMMSNNNAKMFCVDEF